MKCLCPICSSKNIKLLYEDGFDFLDNDSFWLNCKCSDCNESFLTLFVANKAITCLSCKNSDLGLYPEEEFSFIDNELVNIQVKCYTCKKSFLAKLYAKDFIIGE